MQDFFSSWAWPWWSVMVLFNSIQVIICLLYVRAYRRQETKSTYARNMMILGLIFTFVAAYRSVFVSRYLTQLAWFDTIANSSLLIRSMAFFAEMSFALLFALALRRFEEDSPSSYRSLGGYKILQKGPTVLVVCIFLAQFFAYGGLIFKSRLSFAIEETLWSVGFFAILPLAIMQARRAWQQRQQAENKTLLVSSTVVAVWCVVYCTYGVVFHLPFEYWTKAIEQLHTNIPAMQTGWSAVANAFSIVNETKEYQDWGFGFLFWHSAYFTVCVWIALLLMRAPRKHELIEKV